MLTYETNFQCCFSFDRAQCNKRRQHKIKIINWGQMSGTTRLQTKAASWLADLIVRWFGLDQSRALAILAVISMFLIVIPTDDPIVSQLSLSGVGVRVQ
jgi:hypothetical protein